MPITRRASLVAFAGAAFAGAVPLLAAPHVARAAPRPVRLGHNTPEDAHYGQGALAFIAAVARAPVLAGLLHIKPFANAELGDDFAMLRACVNGTLDLLICSNAASSTVVPEHGVMNAPFLFRDTAHARAVLDGPLAGELAVAERAAGLHVLAWGENGMRHVTANRPIRSLADFRGLHIRVPQSTVMQAGLKALGAEPGQLSFTMLREALRTGEFEAEENPIIMIEAIRLYELHNCVSLTAHVYDPAFFAASSDLLAELSAPQVEALRACAAVGAAKTRDVAAEAEREGIARLRMAGMRVVADVRTDELRAAAQPYLASMADVYGPWLPSLFSPSP